MKKLIALLLALLMIFCLIACSNEEEEEREEDDKKVTVDTSLTTKEGTFEYDVNDDGDYEIVKYTAGSLEHVDLVLPKETADGRDIVGIAANAFNAVLTIKSVTIPDTYTYIADYAFYGCDNLENVVMSDSIETVGKGAFLDCLNLAKLTLSKGIKTISKDAFKGCTSIASVDLSYACETIQTGAFYGCTSLTEVVISDKINYLSAYAFYGCTALEYTVENGAKYIGNDENPYVALVCAEDFDIESCTVNDATKLIAERAFAYCADLKTVTLGDAVTVINGTCFENDPDFDKKFEGEFIPVVSLDFDASTYEFGCYLGTEENPYMVLLYIIATNDDDFKIHDDTKIIADTAFENSKIKDISYAGTEAEWDAIIKGENWNHDRNINVLCSDTETE